MATIIIRTDKGIVTEHYSLLPAYNDCTDEEKNAILIELTSPR